MARRGQHRLSDSQKRNLWARWKEGQPMSAIARACGGELVQTEDVHRRAGSPQPRGREECRPALSGALLRLTGIAEEREALLAARASYPA